MKLLKSLAITVTGIFFSTQVLAAFIPLKVQEEDGSPSDSNVKVIKVTNGTLTDNGTGDVSINTGGTDVVTQTDGIEQSAATTIYDWGTEDFTLTESPADDFDIVIADNAIDFDNVYQDNSLSGNPAFLSDECFFATSGMISYLIGRDNATSGISYPSFNPPHGVSLSWQTDEDNNVQVIPAAGTLKNFQVWFDSTPGAGATYIFTVRKNKSDTALTVTFGAADSFKSDTTNSVSVAAGDRITIEIDKTGTPATEHFAWIIEYERTGEAALLGLSAETDSGTPRYASLTGLSNWNSLEASGQQVIPTAGTIKNFNVYRNVAPGAGTTETLEVIKNGSSTTLSIAYSDTDSGAKIDTDSFTVAAGDQVWIKRTNTTGTPATSETGWGVTFVPDVIGQYPLMLAEFDDLHATDTEYTYLMGVKGWNSDDTVRKIVLPSGITVKDWYVELQNDPDTGKSFKFDIAESSTRDGALSDTALTITIANAATTGNDTSNTLVTTADTYLTIESQPTGTPDVGNFYSGIVLESQTSGGGFICEGSTANTNEQLYLFPDGDGADTVDVIVTDDATQTLTNKTIDTADNTITVVEADISDLAHTATAITDNIIVEADLKAVDSASDEECLTYESTGGDFEWQACGSGGFSDAADPIVQNTTTKDVHIGDGADTLTGKFEVGADADQPQVVIEGFSTQTDSILIVQRDDNIQIVNVDNDGRIRLLDDAGSGANLNMIHNGSNGFIQTTVGGFVINAADGKQVYQDSGSTGFNFVVNVTTDEAMFATEDATGNQVIITNDGNSGKDHDHATTTNPTLFVHSDTDPDTANDEWISITHDVTDGVIDVGSGGIKLPDLTNCDTIDTDGNGLLSCGTDDGSGAGSVSVVGLATAQQSATDATELTGFNVTLAANSLSTDNAVRIEGSGTFDEGSTGSGGLNIDVTYGATTVTAFIDHADTTDSVGYGWKAKAYLSADGATNDQQLSVHVIACRQTDTEESCIGDHSTNALAIDSTAGQTLKLTAQQTSGGAGDSITLEYSSAELIQAP